MPLKEGWEVSPDRHKEFEQMLSTDEVGDPILTSKGKQYAPGFLIVSNMGIAWRDKKSVSISLVKTLDAVFGSSGGKSSYWIRWHDVATITSPPQKPGRILVEVNKRKKGVLLINRRGIPKTKNLWFFIKRNRNETYIHFEQRKAEFFGIMKELYKQYKSDANPPTSDSRT